MEQRTGIVPSQRALRVTKIITYSPTHSRYILILIIQVALSFILSQKSTYALLPAHTHTHTYIYIYIYIYKGKAIPLEASIGPEGSRRLRLPDFKTIDT
jgi:hypothetical protein